MPAYNKYMVTRQSAWPDGRLYVEVAIGGWDYSNPGALSRKYPGEMQEYEDPREAVKVAYEIAERWSKDIGEEIGVGVGYTGGYTIPFEEDTKEYNLAWAEREWERQPKCDRCGGINKEGWYDPDSPDSGSYCSEHCLDAQMAEDFKVAHQLWVEENTKEIHGLTLHPIADLDDPFELWHYSVKLDKEWLGDIYPSQEEGFVVCQAGFNAAGDRAYEEVHKDKVLDNAVLYLKNQFVLNFG